MKWKVWSKPFAPPSRQLLSSRYSGWDSERPGRKQHLREQRAGQRLNYVAAQCRKDWNVRASQENRVGGGGSGHISWAFHQIKKYYIPSLEWGCPLSTSPPALIFVLSIIAIQQLWGRISFGILTCISPCWASFNLSVGHFHAFLETVSVHGLCHVVGFCLFVCIFRWGH